MYWFNPVLWVAYILLCRDIELACDEGVIKELCADQRADYSDALLSCSVPRRMIDACPLAFGEIGVKERVKNVLNYKKPTFWLVFVAIIICLVVAVCFLTNPKKAPISFSTIQITWANTLDMRPNEPTSYKLNDAELGELKDRLRDLEIGRKNNDYGGFTPVYSLSIKAQGMEQFMIASYNSDGTHVGLMYQGEYYRIENDDFSRYLSNICAGSNRSDAPGNKGGLSLNDVIILSQKGEELSWEDFEQFSYVEAGSGLYIRVYEINPLFSLWIGGGNPDNEPMYISLRTNTEPEDAIDIRTEDVAAFISKHRDDLAETSPPVSDPNEDMELMPGGLPRVSSENNELNKAFINAKLLPDTYWETDNKTNLPIEGAAVSIPSGRLAFAFLPTRPREEESIFIDEATLKQIISEINVAKVLPKASRIDWAQADFQDYRLNLYILTDGNVYNRIELWGPIRHKKDVYVDISVRSVDSTYAHESWRIESSALGQILIDTWGSKFDLKRLHDVTRIDMRVLNFHDTTKVGNTATLEGDAAQDMAERMLKTAKIVTGYGSCGYNIELCFTFSDGTTELGWLNGDSCTGIAMDNGPNIMFDKEITRELYKLLDYGDDFISD
ncbi:BlaR1 peptidase M56 [Anaerobium acetethylicum]|uniref:BlaR1 peptidase M56 n=1 Tax=Anaerobium acetethylicum TaxID=1619234 RepID=A0A1D3TTW5_9FIRM|nr:BlaR1 peptidase M56 [Anaerobium acetethylicum]